MIEGLEQMLKAEGLSCAEIRERIRLIQTITYRVDELIGERIGFKGLGLFGSIMGKRFNNISDIDVSLTFGGSTINEEMIVGVTAPLEEMTQRSIDPSFNWRKEIYQCMELPPSPETGWSFFVPAFFGVYIGDESYRRRTAEGIVSIIKPEGQGWWDIVRIAFGKLGHKDLTNAEGNFSLSSFEKVCSDYGCV